MNKPVLYISIGALIAFLISAIIVSSFNLLKQTAITNNGEMNNNQNAAIFNTQSATIDGVVTNKAENMITVKGNNDLTESFSISQNVQITKFESGKNQPMVSTNQQDIEINKKVSLVLVMKENTYEVVNITYIPEMPTPPLPPQTKSNTATSSAKTPASEN